MSIFSSKDAHLTVLFYLMAFRSWVTLIKPSFGLYITVTPAYVNFRYVVTFSY